MKLLILSLLLSLNVLADSPGPETQQCKEVTLTVCKGQKAVVVAKKKKKKTKVVVAPTPAPVPPQKEVVVIRERRTVDVTRKNVIFAYGQRKITDLDVSTGPNTAKVESIRKTVLGLGYQRLFDNSLMLGAGIDTESDIQVQVGISW